MFMLSLCFILQFILGIVCLAVVGYNQQYSLLLTSWQKLSYSTVRKAQIKYDCCGFNLTSLPMDKEAAGCPDTAQTNCYEIVKDGVTKGLTVTGGIALAFSFLNVSDHCIQEL